MLYLKLGGKSLAVTSTLIASACYWTDAYISRWTSRYFSCTSSCLLKWKVSTNKTIKTRNHDDVKPDRYGSSALHNISLFVFGKQTNFIWENPHVIREKTFSCTRKNFSANFSGVVRVLNLWRWRFISQVETYSTGTVVFVPYFAVIQAGELRPYF